MNLNFEFQKAFGIVYTEKILEQCGGRGTDPHAIENSYKYVFPKQQRETFSYGIKL